MLLLPTHQCRTACKIEQHHRFSRSYQVLKQGHLHIRQVQVGTAGTLSALLGHLAHGTHNHIGLGGNAQRLSTSLLVIHALHWAIECTSSL